LANDSNLIPNAQRTPSELREMTTKGGIASGIARRKKRDLKKGFEIFGNMPLTTKECKDILEKGENSAFMQYQEANLPLLDMLPRIIWHKAVVDQDRWAMEKILEIFGAIGGSSQSISGSGSDTYNTMVFINQSAVQVVNDNYEDLKNIATKHNINMKPKEEMYLPQKIIVANPNDPK